MRDSAPSVLIAYMPTPRQIAAACLSIQRRWTIAERRRRIVGGTTTTSSTRWLPPSISMPFYDRVRGSLEAVGD